MIGVDKNKNQYLMPGAIVIAGLLISLAIVIDKQPQNIESDTQNEKEKIEETSEVMVPINAFDHIRGSRDAEIFFIEYSDYACGFCGMFHQTVKQIIEESEGKVAWIYRHTPYQRGGMALTIASECVTEQLGEDAFWAFTDSLFENQRAASPDWALAKAKELGVNEDQYNECLTSGKYDDRIQSFMTEARGLGGGGTPFSVFVNNEGVVQKKFSGAQQYADVKILLNSVLNSL